MGTIFLLGAQFVSINAHIDEAKSKATSDAFEDQIAEAFNNFILIWPTFG